jgi:hypothetical protein
VSEVAIATIAFDVPWAISEQIRLIDKHLTDPYDLTVFDNSRDHRAAREIRNICDAHMTTYVRLSDPKHEHHTALNAAAEAMLRGEARYIGWLDHDVFPCEITALIPLIDTSGFLALGQRHHATGRLYPWPGFLFMDREWLDGRPLDFTGIRGAHKRDDGDTGSGLWPLFAEEEWQTMYLLPHGYRMIREPDDHGLQSSGIEVIGDWLHLTNLSGWMEIPDPAERERLLRDMVAAC